MRSRLVLFLFVSFLSSGSALQAQANPPSKQDMEREWRAVFEKKVLILRSFSAQRTVQMTWDGKTLRGSAFPVHILGVWHIDSVHVKAASLQLSAHRYTLGRMTDGSVEERDPAIPVELDLTFAAALPDPQKLLDALFFRETAAARTAIPAAYKFVLPAKAMQVSRSKKGSAPTPACDCAVTAGSCADEERTLDTGLTSAKPLHIAEPEFGAEARDLRASGSNLILLNINSSGKVSDIWVARPAGLGFDEQSVFALSRSTFTPPLCHGNPTSQFIFIETNFDRF